MTLEPTQVDVVRRYLDDTNSAHLILVSALVQDDVAALCGKTPATFWKGGNGPHEIAKAHLLTVCVRCVRELLYMDPAS